MSLSDMKATQALVDKRLASLNAKVKADHAALAMRLPPPGGSVLCNIGDETTPPP